jgi:hypothetical protein
MPGDLGYQGLQAAFSPLRFQLMINPTMVGFCKCLLDVTSYNDIFLLCLSLSLSLSAFFPP